MKPSTPHPGKTGRDFVKRLQACIPRAHRKTHRLSANVTGEEDWEVDEPQIRMSRAFAIMLILHLVALGGLFAFHVFGKDDREAEGTATRNAHEKSTPPPAAAKPATAAPVPSAPAIPRAEIVEEGPTAPASQHHFKAGETKGLIAAKYGITVRELEDANIKSGFNAGDTLVIPSAHKVIGALAEAAPPANPPLALIVATPSEDVGHRDFALKDGAENPYAPVEPAELEAAAPVPAAPRARLVKAEPAPSVIVAPQDADADETASPPARKKVTPGPAPVAPAKPKPATGSRSHVIGKGDTIYNVAKRYGISPNEVMRANGISDPSRLQMGQVLKITVKR